MTDQFDRNLEMTVFNFEPTEDDNNSQDDDDEDNDSTNDDVENIANCDSGNNVETVVNIDYSPSDENRPKFDIWYDSDVGNDVVDSGTGNDCEESDTGNDIFTTTSDTEETDSDALEPEGHARGRRQSKWSATILFVASEVQLIINLAELCPPEGFEHKPIQVGIRTDTIR